MFGQVVMLRDRSLKELNINIDDLSPESYKQVYVKCQSCNEEFLRERRLVAHHHACQAYLSCEKPSGDRHRAWPVYEISHKRLECKKLHPNAKLPFRSRTTDAGYDISSIESVVIPPHGTATVATGIALSAPSGYYYTIDGRSSLWMKGIIPFRGIVDGTYTGPLIVVLMNTTDKPYVVEVNDRIAQIILHEILHCDITIVEEFSDEYNQRGERGFGSTGK